MMIFFFFFFSGLMKSKLGSRTHPGFLFCVHGVSKSRLNCKLEEDRKEDKLSFQQFKKKTNLLLTKICIYHLVIEKYK